MLPDDQLAVIDTAAEETATAHRLLTEAATALTAAHDRLNAAFGEHDSSGRVHATGSLQYVSDKTGHLRDCAAHTLYCLGRFRAED